MLPLDFTQKNEVVILHSKSTKFLKAIHNKTITTSVLAKMINHKTVEFLIIHYNGKSLIIYNKDIPSDRVKGNVYIKHKLKVIKTRKGISKTHSLSVGVLALPLLCKYTTF